MDFGWNDTDHATALFHPQAAFRVARPALSQPRFSLSECARHAGALQRIRAVVGLKTVASRADAQRITATVNAYMPDLTSCLFYFLI